MKLDNNAHSVFLLYYHLILVVKYRRQVFDDQISDRAKEIFEYIAPGYNITLQEWNHDKDHVHIMFRAHPNTQVSRFINAYKSASSRLLKKEFPEIRRKLWKDHLDRIKEQEKAGASLEDLVDGEFILLKETGPHKLKKVPSGDPDRDTFTKVTEDTFENIFGNKWTSILAVHDEAGENI